MSQLETFAITQKKDCMFTGHIAAANRLVADLGLMARLSTVTAIIDAAGLEIQPSGFRDFLPQPPCCSGGSIQLASVMRLENLDIKPLTQSTGGLTRQSNQQVHAQAEVGRMANRNMFSRFFKFTLERRIKSGRTSYQGQAPPHGELDDPGQQRRMGEIDNNIGLDVGLEKLLPAGLANKQEMGV